MLQMSFDIYSVFILGSIYLPSSCSSPDHGSCAGRHVGGAKTDPFLLSHQERSQARSKGEPVAAAPFRVTRSKGRRDRAAAELSGSSTHAASMLWRTVGFLSVTLQRQNFLVLAGCAPTLATQVEGFRPSSFPARPTFPSRRLRPR